MPNLNLPTPGVTPGPEWATRINNAFALLNDLVDTGRLSPQGLEDQLVAIAADLTPEALSDEYIAQQVNTSGTESRTSVDNRVKALNVFKTPKEFGAVGDGVADDVVAIENAISSLGTGGGVIELGTHYLSRDIVIRSTNPNVTLLGGTLLNRGIFIGSETDTPADFDLTLDGVTIKYPSIITGRHGLTIIGARRINCRGVRIFNADHSVHIGVRGWQQHTRRVLFDSACVFHGGNAGIYSEQYSSTHFGTGDFHVIGMQFSDLTNSIKMAGVDGIVIEGITSFQRQNPDRERAIDLDHVTWGKIANSNLFESGNEAIRLNRFQNTVVIGNSIAWCGQRTPSSGIILQGGDNDGFSNSNSIISSNFIQWPTKHGIEQTAGTDSVTIASNRVTEPGRLILNSEGQPAWYSGSTALNSFEHFGIVTPAAIRTNAPGNIVTGTDPFTNDGHRFSFGHSGPVAGSMDGRQRQSVYARSLTLSGTSTTIDAARGYERVNCNHSSPTIVDTITKPEYSGAQLRITAFNSNTTILHSSGSVVLKGAVSAAMPTNGVLTLECTSNVWREVSRSW